jgi:hypothetical protein
MDEDWNNIRPDIWTLPDERLYMYISPSGITHVGRIIDNRRVKAWHHEFIIQTLCGRTICRFDKNGHVTGWRRPSTQYLGSGYIQDPFHEVTCSICKKHTPEFKEPAFEINTAPYGSHKDNPDIFLTYEIPNLINEYRCDTCAKVCDPKHYIRRLKAIETQAFEGTRQCNSWTDNAYYRRQRALILTDKQIQSLPFDRLRLIYDEMMHGGITTSTKVQFISRLVPIMKEKESNNDR